MDVKGLKRRLMNDGMKILSKDKNGHPDFYNKWCAFIALDVDSGQQIMCYVRRSTVVAGYNVKVDIEINLIKSMVNYKIPFVLIYDYSETGKDHAGQYAMKMNGFDKFRKNSSNERYGLMIPLSNKVELNKETLLEIAK